MTKPSREKILDAWASMQSGKYSLVDVEAFYNLAYSAGQADQREKDAGICLRQTYSPDTDPMVECADAIRSQSND